MSSVCLFVHVQLCVCTWHIACPTSGVLVIQQASQKEECALQVLFRHHEINSYYCQLNLPVNFAKRCSVSAQANRQRRPFIIRLRHIPFGVSVKLRQFDGGLSVELGE